MVTLLAILSIWVLLNVLFVLIVIPPRKSRSRPSTLGTPLSPAPIDKKRDQIVRDEPSSLRQLVMSVAMGAIFALVPPLLALRNAISRLFFKKTHGGPPPGA